MEPTKSSNNNNNNTLSFCMLSYQILMNVKTMVTIIAKTSWIVRTQKVVIIATSENLH